jgi:hypothetical protein
LAVTEPLATPNYDEGEIAGRIAAMPSSARALFACACAERLMAVFRWFCDMTGSTSFKAVREALDAAWSPDPTVSGAGQRELAELMPDDEEGELALGYAVAQNAVACVAYAVAVRQTGAAEPAVWAARQLYEAADAVVQQGAGVQSYVDNIDQEPPVQLMARGIHVALDSAIDASPAGLLAEARADGEAFLGFVSGRN